MGSPVKPGNDSNEFIILGLDLTFVILGLDPTFVILGLDPRIHAPTHQPFLATKVRMS
jgi:hypothetical protein